MRNINRSFLTDAELELVSGGLPRPTVSMRGASQSNGNIQLNEEPDELFEPQAVAV